MSWILLTSVEYGHEHPFYICPEGHRFCVECTTGSKEDCVKCMIMISEEVNGGCSSEAER